MTVQELIEALKSAPPDAEVRIAYDSGFAYSDARSVIIGPGHIYVSVELPTEEGTL